MTKQEAVEKYPKNNARYLLCANTSDVCVDARYINDGVDRFINSASRSGKANNSHYTDRHLNIRSHKRKIKAGTEITIAYGPGHTTLKPRPSQEATKVGTPAGSATWI